MATIRLAPGVRTANGTSKADLIFGNDLDNTLAGGAGNDVIEGGAGADFIYGDAAGGLNYEDTASYASSSAAVYVDLGRATQYGGDAAGDVLFSIENLIGSAFDDFLTGDGAKNKIEGGAGNDSLSGGIDGLIDTLDGGSGTDSADYSTSGEGLIVQLDRTVTFTNQFGVQQYVTDGSTKTAAGVTEDILRNIEDVIGSAFNDTITGNEKANVIDGGMGADTINGLGGNDTVEYRLGVGTIHYSSVERQAYDGQNGVDVDLSRTLQRGGAAEGDRLFSIENITGSFGHDILKGNNSANVLDGGKGDDTIHGGGGNDTIVAGSGFDVLDGGAGNDTFVYGYGDLNRTGAPSSYGYRRRAFGYDTIENFESGRDKLDFSAFGANGGEAFVFVDAFTGTGSQLIYDGSSLLGDVDGDRLADIRIDVIGLQRSDVIL